MTIALHVNTHVRNKTKVKIKTTKHNVQRDSSYITVQFDIDRE